MNSMLVRKLVSRPAFRGAPGWRRWLVAICFCAAISAGSARAQEQVYTLDPVQTQVDYTLPDLLHAVHGTFRLKQGNIRFDPATGAAGGSIVVDAATGDSGSKGRDRRMHEKILETSKYPEITFNPTHIDGQVATQGASQVQVHGSFGLHGEQHEITVPASITASGDQLTASVHFVVPYVKWGLKNPSTLILRVGSNVNIDLHAVGRISAAMPAVSKSSPNTSH